jgi:hypothetical protein
MVRGILKATVIAIGVFVAWLVALSLDRRGHFRAALAISLLAAGIALVWVSLPVALLVGLSLPMIRVPALNMRARDSGQHVKALGYDLVIVGYVAALVLSAVLG